MGDTWIDFAGATFSAGAACSADAACASGATAAAIFDSIVIGVILHGRHGGQPIGFGHRGQLQTCLLAEGIGGHGAQLQANDTPMNAAKTSKIFMMTTVHLFFPALYG